MKITRSQLKQIIREELEQELDEIFGFGKKSVADKISKETEKLKDFRKKMMGTLGSDEPEETESSKKAKKSRERAKEKLAALKKAHESSKETKK
tara:strand:+ start:487 stop:768 length:282 start_codon:yes stop_codon:yes gene_type:complete